jgi:CheY-like chemotaxis protein
VDDLLDVSRFTRGKVELRKERIEVAAVAARAIEMSSPVMEKKRQVLVVRIPPRGLVVDADPSRLAQVLANLLTNAAKYSDTDSEIVLAAEHDRSDVLIRVTDRGIGLAPEMQSRVFDLFVQNRQSIDRSEGGLGLGLTIVRSLVRLHGGTVRAYSEGEGRGSEFVVTLPRAAGEVTQTLGRDPAAVASLDDGGRHPAERILIVDDNQDGAELLATLLLAKGHDTRVAHDGPTALRLAAAFLPNIAFLDLGLPVMDGYELASRLREIPGLDRLRLVAVTGYGQESDRRRTCEAGFDHHLVKPVDIAAIEATLARPSQAPIA